MLKKLRFDQLDFVRGFALLTITVSHFTVFVSRAGYLGVKIPTLSSVGFSSSAPLFFMVSGMLLGIIYFNKRDNYNWLRLSSILLSRAVMILTMNCVLFVMVLAIFSFAPNPMEHIFQLQTLRSQPYIWAYNVFTLGYNLPLLDILNVYVVFMIVAIPFSWLTRYSVTAALLALLGAYFVAQTSPDFTLRGGNQWEDGIWSFNPLAWGGFFLGGMLAGRYNLHEKLRELAVSRARGRLLTVSLVLIYLACAVLTRLHWSGTINIPAIDKATMQPVRLFHALVTFLGLLAFLFRYEQLKQFPPYRLVYNSVALVGKYSLHSFMASVVLNYAMLLFWLQVGGTTAYIGIALVGMLALVLFASALNALKAARTGALNQPDKASEILPRDVV